MKTIEQDILFLIYREIATNKKSMASTLQHFAADGTLLIGPVENALERMKRKDWIRYDGPTKSWKLNVDQAGLANIVSEDKAALNAVLTGQFPGEPSSQNVSPPSQPSAPTVDAVIGSENTNNKEATSSGGSQTPITSENIMNTKTNEDNTSKIDAAINAAKSRKVAKNTAGENTMGTEKRPRLTAEAKQARDLARDMERAVKKEERDRVRTAKQAAKQAQKSPAHMAKVDKAAAKLPTLDNAVGAFFNELTVNFTQSQLTALSSHLQHFNRVKATERAINQKVALGSKVRITGGEIRYIGMEGTVSKAQRIRCYVEVEGVKKPIYLFTSDVEVLEAASAPKSAVG